MVVICVNMHLQGKRIVLLELELKFSFLSGNFELR